MVGTLRTCRGRAPKAEDVRAMQVGVCSSAENHDCGHRWQEPGRHGLRWGSRAAPGRHSSQSSLAVAARCSVPSQAASMLPEHHTSLFLCRSCRLLSWYQNWAGDARFSSWCHAVQEEHSQVMPRRCQRPRFLPGHARAGKPLQTPCDSSALLRAADLLEQ